MTEEAITEKSILDYLGRFERLQLQKKETKEVQKRIIDKLNVLTFSLGNVMNKIGNNQEKIEDHWKQYGANYNSIPVLYGSVPNFIEGFGEFISLSHKEKTILVEEMIVLLKLADKTKQEVKPVVKK
jgi:hypothetical protein|tara:strand:+ start:1547 stop:1927 length:381 start_codon:yes stop_codon:yes gene_type:complete